MSDNESEAMEVWRKAVDAASDGSIKFKPHADQAAARVIATALEARDAEWTLYKAKVLMEHGERIAERDARMAELKEVLGEARRAIGDHFAPNDCYATGPLTGDPYRDLVECPACSFIAMHDAILTKQEPKA